MGAFETSVLEVYCEEPEGLPPGDAREPLLLAKAAAELRQDLLVAAVIAASCWEEDGLNDTTIVLEIAKLLALKRRDVRAAISAADEKVRRK
jgi:hypothetical protein